MPNPFAAPRVTRRPSAPQSLSQLEQFVVRLRAIGATDEEVETVRQTWDDLSDDWTVADRTKLTRLSDEQLRDELVATRAEYQHDTTTEQQQDATDAATFQQKVRAEAAEVIGRNIGAVLQWVGTDPIRAIVILELEQSEHGAARKGIIEPLTELVAGDDPDGIPVQYAGERPVES